MIADAPDAPWQVEAGAVQRTLVERDAAGARLVKESGPLARLRIVARPAWAPAGRIEFRAALAHGRLDYDGRTQAGAALATHSRHDEAELGAKWSASNAFAWGTPALTFDGLRLRRAIAASGAVGSLTETSTLWMPGVAWTGPAWTVAGAAVSARARWRASVHHHLAVDYGALFDASSLHGGRRTEFALGAGLSLARGWAVSLEWSRAREAASGPAPIYRSGVVVGQVREPRIEIEDATFTLSKSF